MKFELSELAATEYRQNGYIVLRNIIPPSLIHDLRIVAEKARALCRKLHGPDAQRLQPLTEPSYELDQRPLEDFVALPELNRAIETILTPRHQAGLTGASCLFEPSEKAWATNWHRDWRDTTKFLSLDEWDKVWLDYNIFNQFNCALYEDSCTWYVPGSHLRRDTPVEQRMFPTRPIVPPHYEGTPAEVERALLAYCRSMPGATRVYLDAGDFLMYRNTGWHIGSYVPGKIRATLHGGAVTPEFATWRDKMTMQVKEREASGLYPAYECPHDQAAAIPAVKGPPEAYRSKIQVPLGLNALPPTR